MSIVVEGGIIQMRGVCGADDVEDLIEALQDEALRGVDFSDTDHLHGAVLQALLAFTPEVFGSPRDSFVRTWLIPVLREARRMSQSVTVGPPNLSSLDRRRNE